MYRWKQVEQVAQIEAVVDVSGPADGVLLWKNGSRAKKLYIERAISKVMQLRPDSLPIRCFLLGDLHETEFRKGTPHGLWGKRYFGIGALGVESAVELADALRGKTWSQIREG